MPGPVRRCAELEKLAPKAIAAICGQEPKARRGRFEARSTQPTGEASVASKFTPGEESGILATASKVESAKAATFARRAF
jgi:hypothetical protein